MIECATVNDGDDGDERPEAAERDHQAEQEQQVVGAVEDVLEAELARSAAPPGATADRAARVPGSPGQLERPLGAVGRHGSAARSPLRMPSRASAGSIEKSDWSDGIGYSNRTSSSAWFQTIAVSGASGGPVTCASAAS